ncbi:MAG: hypothetical protein AAF847_19430 [Bacteroidota bacterium]
MDTSTSSSNKQFNNIAEILEHYGIEFEYNKFFAIDEIAELQLDDFFIRDLEFSLSNRGAHDKEFFSSEFIIVPFLKEAWKRHEKVTLFSHVNLKVNEFNLYPDYILGGKHKTGVKILQKPLLLTIEAKDEKVEQGWMEALLQLIAAQQFNQTDQVPVHAIVTTADNWYFGKLTAQLFQRHPFPVGIDDPEKLFGVLDYIFSECEKYVS